MYLLNITEHRVSSYLCCIPVQSHAAGEGSHGLPPLALKTSTLDLVPTSCFFHCLSNVSSCSIFLFKGGTIHPHQWWCYVETRYCQDQCVPTSVHQVSVRLYWFDYVSPTVSLMISHIKIRKEILTDQGTLQSKFMYVTGTCKLYKLLGIQLNRTSVYLLRQISWTNGLIKCLKIGFVSLFMMTLKSEVNGFCSLLFALGEFPQTYIESPFEQLYR